ncbi:unnamed protein product [Boreogadus saida]
MGVAVARYDFSSRDMRELSLQEGDLVTIYTKTGANGWWRGEVNGRVGWFPSSYVEEGEGELTNCKALDPLDGAFGREEGAQSTPPEPYDCSALIG